MVERVFSPYFPPLKPRYVLWSHVSYSLKNTVYLRPRVTLITSLWTPSPSTVPSGTRASTYELGKHNSVHSADYWNLTSESQHLGSASTSAATPFWSSLLDYPVFLNI